MAAITAGRRPSLKFGTHSTSLMGDGDYNRPAIDHRRRGHGLLVGPSSDEENMPNDPSLTELSVADFLDRLASGAPTPGGGSAASLAGALAAALTSMVCNLT